MASAPAVQQKGNGTGTTIAKADPVNQRMMTLTRTLDAHKEKIEAALAKGMSADRIIQIARLITFKTPDLLKCESSSILAAIIRAASLRLDLEPSAMEAYLIPRKNNDLYGKGKPGYECNFQIGYQGLRKMVLRTGDVAAFETRLVFENEIFELEYTPELKMHHKPILQDSKRGDIIGGYGYGRMKGGDPFISFMELDEILSLKARGSGKQPAWQTDFLQMCHKTICIRLAKQFPKSQELIDVLRDEHAMNGIDFESEDRARQLTGTAGLKQRLAIESEPQPEPEFNASEGVANPVYSEGDEPVDAPFGTEPDDVDSTEGGRAG